MEIRHVPANGVVEQAPPMYKPPMVMEFIYTPTMGANQKLRVVIPAIQDEPIYVERINKDSLGELKWDTVFTLKDDSLVISNALNAQRVDMGVALAMINTALRVIGRLLKNAATPNEGEGTPIGEDTDIKALFEGLDKDSQAVLT